METPARIGKYEIEKYLGGGMSRVYKARDPLIGRTVVVKVLTDEGCKDPEAKARFLQEARMAGNIIHDNIIRIYDFGEDSDGYPYMVMEFLEGEDLSHLIRDNKIGATRQKLTLALQVSRALEQVHANGIIHRDIKPENVHVNGSGTVKLMDFGIAKTENFSITRPGYIVGTPYYMPPEQVMGQPVTTVADVYSFGVLLFELMTGVKPISAETIDLLFYRILKEPLDLTPLETADTPQAIKDLIAHCTAKAPADRPQTMKEVSAVLERELASFLVAPEAPPVPVPAPSRTGLYIGLSAAVIVVLAVVAWLAMRPKALSATLSTPAGEMVLVPAGPFLFGEEKKSVELPAFYIDKTEVTNDIYARFCREKARPLPDGFPQDKPGLPVANITIVDAQEFAKWAGKRLPSYQEWEKAARGTDGRIYPWGNNGDASRANVGTEEVKPAGSLPQGESPFHALDMAGNVWEFVGELRTPSAGMLAAYKDRLNDPPTATEPWYVIRGGSYHQPLPAAVTYEWSAAPARYHDASIGFRCAKDPKE